MNSCQNLAENVKKQGGFVPGIRPGPKTAEYLEYVIVRVLVVGSLPLLKIVNYAELAIASFRVGSLPL